MMPTTWEGPYHAKRTLGRLLWSLEALRIFELDINKTLEKIEETQIGLEAQLELVSSRYSPSQILSEH